MHFFSREMMRYDQLRSCRLLFVLYKQRSVRLFAITRIQPTEGALAALEQLVFLLVGIKQSAYVR
jgi:hypothetical protein